MNLFFKRLGVISVLGACIILSVYLPACSKKEEGVGNMVSQDQQLGEELLGGINGTIALQSNQAYAQPIPPMLTADVINFKVGRSFFHTNWVTAPASTQAIDGLGPLFITSSCNSCHVEDGRGRTPASETEQLSSLLIRLSAKGQDAHGGPNPDPDLGLQLRNNAILKANPDGEAYVTYTDKEVSYADGSKVILRVPAYQIKNLRGDHPLNFMTSPRIAPQLVGMGLLEAIPEANIQALADAQDKDQDGISGRTNLVWNEEKQKMVLGRFGWKANEPTVRQQVAGALSNDIGITSPIFPAASLFGIEQTLFGSLVDGSDKPGQPELPEPNFTYTVFYTEALAVPQRRNWNDATVRRGKTLFTQVACAKCHTPQFRTGAFPDVPLLENQVIHPYTDLLLHDMGSDLADGRNDYLASGTEWRTPPLWGIGLSSLVNNNKGMFLMHDGRARSIEEAILWHGGEAEKSKEAFRQLSATDRKALISFVNDL